MAVEQKIFTSVGYTLAFTSLCSLALVPAAQAVADEGASSQGSPTTYSTSQSNAPVATEKNETVNVGTYADGSVKNVEVSTTLKANGSVDVADATSLSDLKPDDDDVWFTNEGELVWHSPAGEDVVYTGTTQSSLPLELKVTYRYNGSYITPAELPGKTGHVIIRYDYVNHSTTTVDGVQVYTPFVAITGMLLDADIFSNVKITNGKLIEDGDRMIAVGYAMPGLASSLDAGSDIDVPEYFEIEADVVDFELKSTLTMVSPDMLDGFDSSDFDTGEYADASSGLTSAMAELTKGSGELTDGLEQLADGAKELADGALQLDGGLSATTNEIPALTNGIASLHAGSTQLANGTTGLISGMADAKTAIVQVQGGASQLAGALSSDQLKQLSEVLSYAALELDGDNKLIDAVAGQASAVKGAADSVAGSYGDLTTALSAIEGLSEEDQQKVNAVVAASTLGANVEQLSQQAGALSNMSGQLSTQATQAASGALGQADLSELAAAAQSLADALGAISDEAFGTAANSKSLIGAATQLQAGATQLDQGLAKLESQSGELADGLSQLASGVSQIADGSAQLSEAVNAAAEGSDAMTEGLQQFNDEGISKIADAIDNKLVKLGNRFTAVTDAGGMYKNFAGITEGTAGSVKFVFETDAIEAE